MEKICAYSADTIQVVGGDELILAQKKYTDFVKRYMRYAKDGGIVNVWNDVAFRFYLPDKQYFQWHLYRKLFKGEVPEKNNFNSMDSDMFFMPNCNIWNSG